MAILPANAASTLFMTGVAWFVQVVHYPLLGSVGRDDFGAYHAAHSRLTTRVVLVPMSIELITSAWLVVERPRGVGAAAASGGLALAVLIWASTVLVQVPQHRELAQSGVRSLIARNWPRTAAWSARSALVLGMLAAAA